MIFKRFPCDAALAILTVHHWSDVETGLAELRRVARRRAVILTWDPETAVHFWMNDYIPRIWDIDREIFPKRRVFANVLGSVVMQPVLIPEDCTDGFMGAYWKRPDAYLDPDRRGAISTFAKIGDVSAELSTLRSEILDGAWGLRNAALEERTELDLGYRLVIASFDG